MPENNSDNVNNETEQPEKKKDGLWKRFTALSLRAKFFIVLSAVLAIFLIAIIVMLTITVESFRPNSNVPYPNWYGFLIGMAIVLGAVGCQYAALRQGFYFDIVFDYVVFAVPFAFAGGMIYYKIFSGPNSGIGLGVLGSMIGALIGLLLAMLVYRLFVKKKPKVSLMQILDIAGIFILLGMVFGRMGCYVSGNCCYGVEVSKEVFPFSYHVVNKAGQDLGIHLGNPFIEAIWCFIGFVIMLPLFMSKRKSFNGFYFSLYCIWYGTERLILEFFRDPHEKLQADTGYGNGFGISQVVSIIMIAFGITWIAVYLIRALVTKKKVMILVPKDKLSEDYLDYTHTIYYRPHVDEEGHPIDYDKLEAAKAETPNGSDGTDNKE